MFAFLMKVLSLLLWPQLGRPALLGWPKEQAPRIPANASADAEPRIGGIRMDGHATKLGGRGISAFLCANPVHATATNNSP